MTGVVVWLTGLPSSGKSTLAARLRARLVAQGRWVILLDGDEVRDVLRPRPGHDAAARDAFYATLGGLAALLARQALVVLVPATAHQARYRAEARAAAPAFVEVHVATTPEVCSARDAKGLYAAARAGTLSDLPGVDVAYEPPARAEVTAAGGQDEAALEGILARIAALS